MPRLAIRFGLLIPLLLLLVGCRAKTELVWHDEGTHRWADLGSWDGSKAGFRDIDPSRSGVTFVNTLREESLLRNRHYMNGSGVAVGDVDGDGWSDLYFARLDGPNVLYRNLGGWRFEDVTEQAGVAVPERYSTGAVFADVDGDGDLDLLVTAMGGPNALFVNDGQGHFTDVTGQAGLTSDSGSTTMALSDVDGDGDLDLFVSNYKVRAVNDIYPPHERTFERTVERIGDTYRVTPEFADHYELKQHAGGLLRVERAEPNRLYLNDGNGHFEPVSFTEGSFHDAAGRALAEAPEDWTLVARFQDVNGDGAPDLYVCNDFQSPDYLWLGDGQGGFRQIEPLAIRKTSFSTMSVDFSDIDRDGDLDFFLTDMLSRNYQRRQMQVGLTIPMTTGIGEVANRPQVVQNTLQVNRGDGTFAEVARISGVAASDWTWSGLFMDVDLDGYEDLLLSTGHLYDVTDKDAQMREFLSQEGSDDPDAFRRSLLDYPPLPLHNVAFRNNGDLSFDFVEDGWGIGRAEDVANALAFGDLDNDGDLDAVVNRINATAGLFRNEARAPRVAVRLRGAAPNTQGVGAKIRVLSEALPVQQKEVVSGGIYLSGSDPVYSFAAHHPDAFLAIEVRWRDGTRTRLDSARANRLYEIYHPEHSRAAISQTRLTSGSASDAGSPSGTDDLFTDVSNRIAHRHVDAPFADFERNPLLRRGRSRLGPGVAWADVDRDGDEDLFVGSGRGGKLVLYQNTGDGTFSLPPATILDAEGDLTGIVYHAAHREGRLLVGESNHELAPTDSSWIHVITLDDRGRAIGRDRLSFGRAEITHLSLGDVDGDGDLDLFAGGRRRPDESNESAARIFLNRDGSFRPDAPASEAFRDVNSISSSAFGDMDLDGDQDLVLATDWGPVTYFENEGGRFVDRTQTTGLADYSGWWNGIALGDFDGDGLLDVIATNWGWNGEHGRLHLASNPLRLYRGDFDLDGTTDAVQAAYEVPRAEYVPVYDFDVLSQAMPFVRQRIASYEAFAGSSLREIVGFRLDQAQIQETSTLTSMVFLNRLRNPEKTPGSIASGESRFDAVSLPLPAQFAPAFAPIAGDFDGDGTEDLFLSQNFFNVPMQVARQDAGRGLLLLGDGEGNFEAISGMQSGITVYGEQRGAAAADFDGDGRLDFVVTQHGAETKLYENAAARAGLRVSISGPPQNPTGVGAQIRLHYVDGTAGPSRIISAGSGYWSQNSAVQILGTNPDRAVAAVSVRWPLGAHSSHPVPTNTSELTLTTPRHQATHP